MNGGNRPRRGRPERLGDVLATMFRRAGMNEIARLQRVAAAWKECLPEHARSGSRVTKLVDGVIHAAVDSAPLNFELSGFMKPELLRRIRQKDIGYIRDIRFKVVSTSPSSGTDVPLRGKPKRDPNYNPAH